MTIAPVTLPISPASPAPHKAAGEDTFRQAFAEAVAKVEEFQNASRTSLGKFLSGEGEELHQVALRAQQAELSFQLFLEVRNKIVAAYQEVMRMQV
jgi:flagellar hook-basal body complex protein FliE